MKVALGLASLFFVSMAHATDCSQSILDLMNKSPKFSGSNLEVDGSPTTVKPGGIVFIRGEDYNTQQNIATQLVYVNETKMAVLFNIYAVLVDPSTCQPLQVIPYKVDFDQ